jgi:CheY-like chemotaxis protein
MTDLMMPGMGSLGLARQIAQRFPCIRFIYTSGYTEDGAARRELLQEGTVF